MSTTQTVPQGKDTAIQDELYMSFELGDKSWKLTISDGRRGPSRFSVRAGDTAAVLALPPWSAGQGAFLQ
jgi:transposase